MLQCVPCREGLRQMSKMLHRITDGQGKLKDIDDLENLGKTVAVTALCGLGKSAPNPVLSSIRYFRDEYVAHIVERRCPGGICKAMISYHIVPESCTGCGTCAKVCPTGAIHQVRGEKREEGLLRAIHPDVCEKCGACMEACRRVQSKEGRRRNFARRLAEVR